MRLAARFLIASYLIAFGLASTACSHHPPRVDCDQHLVPINLPTPKPKANTATEPAANPAGSP
jgi:hypothetical protein